MAKNISILIVEDQALVAADLIGRLKGMGHSVSGHASNAKRALELVVEKKPDLVLMDIDIDGTINGIETARAINRIHPVPILYLTKYNDEATFEKATHTQPFDFITKPFNDIRLSRAIKLAIERARQQKAEMDGAKPTISLRVNGKLRRLPLEEILWITAAASYCYLKTFSEELMFSRSLAQLVPHIEGQIDGPSPLLRIHRSTVVNVDNVDGLYTDEVSIHGTRKRIGKNHKQEVRKALGFLNKE